MKQVAGSKCTIAQNLKKNRILREIHQRNQISRSELCGITGLSAPVMSRLTSELINEGLVVEEGISPARDEVGRRGVLLGLNKSARYVVGVDVGASETRLVVCNLGSEVMARHELPTNRTTQAAEFVNFLAEAIKETVAQGRLELKDIDSVIIGVPGSISPDEAKRVTTCNIPALQGIELVGPLNEILGMSVSLTNVSTAWSLAEGEDAQARGEKSDFLLVGCSFGISVVPLVGGKALFAPQTSEDARVDFGHIVTAPNGPQCHCGQKGCIEAYSSGWAIARDAQAKPTQILLDLVDGQVEKITARDVFDAAKRGDNESLALIREAASYYGRWLSLFVQFYMPKKLIFGGQLVEDSLFYYDAMVRELERNIPADRRKKITFQRSALDKYREARGAASMSIHELLNEKIEGLVEMAW